MKCLYYLAPTLDSTHRIADDVHAVGVDEFFLHVISRDEAGLQAQHIRCGNYLETLDLVRDGLIGAAIGVILGLIGVGLLRYLEPFGPHVPNVVYYATMAAAVLFCTWEGGLTGIATQNTKLANFRDDLEAGRYLILIYAAQRQEQAVRKMMRARHPAAQLAATDRHFINPFGVVKRTSTPAWPENGLPAED
jgi:hypothetical protein